METLQEFFANARVVLCDLQNRGVLVYGEALIGDCLLHGVIRVASDAIFVRRRRCRHLLLVVLLDTGHAVEGGSGRIEFLVWGVRRSRLILSFRRSRLVLSIGSWNEEKPRSTANHGEMLHRYTHIGSFAGGPPFALRTADSL